MSDVRDIDLGSTGVAVRSASGLGGLVPSGGLARGAGTLVMALCVEHHGEGAVVPILVVSEAPGVLSWDPAVGLTATDDFGQSYRVRQLIQSGGLGALSATVWLEPAIPSEATRLLLSVDDVTRTSAQHGGRGGAERLLAGGPWDIEIPLRPGRTVTEAPPAPARSAAWPARPSRVPARAPSAFLDLVPVGLARIRDGYAICLSALERYEDRAILTTSVLADQPLRPRALDPRDEHAVEVWDDLGNRYRAVPLGGPAALGWSELAIEISPAIDPEARRLAVRIAQLPVAGEAGRHQADAATFGIALPAG